MGLILEELDFKVIIVLNLLNFLGPVLNLPFSSLLVVIHHLHLRLSVLLCSINCPFAMPLLFVQLIVAS